MSSSPGESCLAAAPMKLGGVANSCSRRKSSAQRLVQAHLHFAAPVDRSRRPIGPRSISSAGELEPGSADNDEPISEIAFIDDAPDTAIVHDRDRTTLQLASPLANVYDRASVRINANVAAATHGESVQEILGSGDAATGLSELHSCASRRLLMSAPTRPAARLRR